MSMSRRLGVLIAFVFLALLVFAPSDAHQTHAGSGEPPPNDDFADATVISELPFDDGPIDVGDATVETNEASSSCNFGGVFSTIWYAYTPPEDAVLVASASTGNSRDAINDQTTAHNLVRHYRPRHLGLASAQGRLYLRR